jgi:membrane associated rhomboid family serine protease
MSSVFLAMFFGILGIIFRAYLDNKSTKLVFYHSIFISPFLGYYAYLKSIPSIDLKTCFFLGFFFFIFGWVFSDVLESIVFIAKGGKHAKH